MSMRHHARKRFGQHFLESTTAIAQIVAAISPRAGQTIVEIGAGRGALTDGLAASGASVHAIEFDRNLVPLLQRRYDGLANVRVHQGDALSFDFAALGAPLRVAGNLPYNISTPLLFRMLEFADRLSDLHFMLQKEVVDRIVASPGSKSFGRLSIMLGRHMHAEWLFDVPPSAFVPPPRVTSSLVRLMPRPHSDLPAVDEEGLSQLVAQAFSQRRKTLRNALKGTATSADLLAVGIDPGDRAECVPVKAWLALANHLAARM